MTTPVPLLFPRVATRTHKLGDLTIEKGTIVNLEISACQHKASFFDEPSIFKPERWEKLENQPNLSQHFIPFSVGQRICLGQQLSMIESRVAVIAFLLNFKNGKPI